MSWAHILTTHEFWAGVPSGAVIGLAGPLVAARASRKSDGRKADHDEKMHKLKVAQEDLRSNREILREAATNFSAVCSAVIEKALDPKSVFNSVMDAAQNMQGEFDKKAFEKIEFAINLMDEAKQITTAFNHLRVVAPVPVLDAATKLNAAVLALTRATTVPLAKPPLMAEAGKAMENFTNAVRGELGLDPYTADDAVSARQTYMETLTKQMNNYIKETQEEAHRFGFLEPGAVPITPIKAGDLTEEHVGKFVGCHDPDSGFNYGAKILKVIRVEEHQFPGMLVRIQHPPIPGGKAAHQERMRLPFDHEVQLVALPDLKPSGQS